MPSTAATIRTALVVLLTAIGVLFSLYLLYRLEGVVEAIVLSAFLGAALNPAVNALHRRRIPRPAAILLVFLAVAVALLVIVTLAVPSLIRQVQGIIQVLQRPGGLTEEIRNVASPFGLGGFVDSLRPQIEALPGQAIAAIGPFATVTSNAVNAVSAILTVVVLTFFLLNDGASLVGAGLSLIPEAQRPRARRLIDEAGRAVSGYITGNLAISLIAGAGVFVGMTILGVPYALALALLLAVFDLIPMVGATLGAIPPILAAFAVSPIKALILLVYIIVYQQIESNVLNPIFYGRSVHLPGWAVFISVLVGGVLMGILGALIAIPIAEIIRLLIAEFVVGGSRSAAVAADGVTGVAAVAQVQAPSGAERRASETP